MSQYRYKTVKDIEKSEEYLELLNLYNHANSDYEAGIWLWLMEKFIDEEQWQSEEYVKAFNKWCEENCEECMGEFFDNFIGDYYYEDGLCKL